MSLLDDLGLQSAFARQAQWLANPKTALATIPPDEAADPAVEEVVRLEPGAEIPKQEPPPEAPAVIRWTEGNYGRVIPMSLGRRRLTGTLIQSTALVPRLVGNKEYEVTYEVPANEDQEPEEEQNDGEFKGKPTIWCEDCNCYYCYVGPLDVSVPFSNSDKGTWPYMAMMGNYRSRLCTSWDYRRIVSIKEDVRYGALFEKNSQEVWNWRPPTGTGLPNDPLIPLTCGPCAEDPPYPDQIEAELEPFGNQGLAPAPHTYFLYAGFLSYDAAPEELENAIFGPAFYYKVMFELALMEFIREDTENKPYDNMGLYRVFYDPKLYEEDQENGEKYPGSDGWIFGPVYLPPGWRFGEAVTSFSGVWSEAETLTGIPFSYEGFNPGGPHWRDFVRDHGGWAPEDEPTFPPEYRKVIVRRSDPDDPFSEFKEFPNWLSGMAMDGDEDPLHTASTVQCEDITDYSDA